MTEFNNHLRHKLERQIRFETQLSEISSRFVNLPTDQIDITIKKAQRSICELLGFDRSVIWQVINREPVRLLLSHIHESQKGRLPESPFDTSKYFPWLVNQILEGKTVAVKRLEDVPPEARRDRESLKLWGTKSVLLLPPSIVGNVIGAVSFACIREEMPWPHTVTIPRSLSQTAGLRCPVL